MDRTPSDETESRSAAKRRPVELTEDGLKIRAELIAAGLLKERTQSLPPLHTDRPVFRIAEVAANSRARRSRTKLPWLLSGLKR